MPIAVIIAFLAGPANRVGLLIFLPVGFSRPNHHHDADSTAYPVHNIELWATR